MHTWSNSGESGEPAASMTIEQMAMGYVLIVMDDRFLRKRLREQVAALGFDVREGLSVRRALDRLTDAMPSLVLLDLWIDHGAGLAFLDGLRERDPEHRIPVLLIGDDPRAAVQVRALDLGALGPVPLADAGEMAAWIERVLAAT